MRDEYDFSKMKMKKNPYAKLFKKQVTMKLDSNTIEYFKKLAEESGVSYQNLINLYLRECVEKGKKPVNKWVSAS